jgi:hypothetical protein
MSERSTVRSRPPKMNEGRIPFEESGPGPIFRCALLSYFFAAFALRMRAACLSRAPEP